MSHKRNRNTILKFIEEYLQHKCLWDVYYNLYKNKEARKCISAYNSIVRVMNISNFAIAKVKTKIKNLPSTYSQKLKKYKHLKDEVQEPINYAHHK